MCAKTKKQKKLNAYEWAKTKTINIKFVKYNSSLFRPTSLQKKLHLMCMCQKGNFQQKKYHKSDRKSVEPFRKSKVSNVQNGEANLWLILSSLQIPTWFWRNNSNIQYQKTISSCKRIHNITEKNNCLKELEYMWTILYQKLSLL